MCELKTFLILITLAIVAATSFCLYHQVQRNEKLEREIKEKDPCENEYWEYCLNGKCFSLSYENIVACYCDYPYGGTRCDKYLWWY